MRAKGSGRCDVEGCSKAAPIAVLFPDPSPEERTGYIEVLPAMVQTLTVCPEHAAQLGEVNLAGDEGYVVIQSERAHDWRLTITVRPSGRWVTILLPPGMVTPEPPPDPSRPEK